MLAIRMLSSTERSGKANEPQAREKMNRLLTEAESNAWEIGDLLNSVEKRGLARRAGYLKTRNWLDAEVPAAAGKTTTLYRYAAVAAIYTKQHVALWGISKLELLMAHDQVVLGHCNPEDPANREVELLQSNGSTVTKKFHDCSWRDLQQSSHRQRQTPEQKSPTGQHGEVRAFSKSATSNEPAPKPEKHSLKVAFAMMALGIVVCTISQILSLDLISGWLCLAGVACFFGGIGSLISHWQDFRERLILAVKEGRALEFLKDQLDKGTRGFQKLAITIRSKMKATKAPTSSPEETPPTQKKAA